MITNFNDHAANERTFLAWVRTAIALVGFGLAIDKLSGDASQQEASYNGVALIAVGALVTALAYARMRKLKAMIDSARPEDDDISAGDSLLALTVGGMALLMILFVLHIG